MRNPTDLSFVIEATTSTLLERQKQFTARYAALYKWACRLTNNSADAEDLLHDCYVAFISSTTKDSIENLDGYLRRMLAYILISKRRRDARYNLIQLDEAHDIHGAINVLAEIEEREHQYAIRRQLRLIYNFAKRTKGGKIFILRYYEKKSGTEVAEFTGMTRAAVNQRVRVARIQINKHFRIDSQKNRV